MNCDCKTNNVIKLLLSLLVLIITIVLVNRCTCNNEKSILTTVAEQGDNTQVGTAIINFKNNEIVIGNAISHEEGSNQININEDGIYQISYQVYGQRETIGTYNFNAVILVNGNILEDTLNETPILRDNVANRMTLTSTVILRLNRGDILQLGTLSIEDIYYTRARIDIEKIY